MFPRLATHLITNKGEVEEGFSGMHPGVISFLHMLLEVVVNKSDFWPGCFLNVTAGTRFVSKMQLLAHG